MPAADEAEAMFHLLMRDRFTGSDWRLSTDLSRYQITPEQLKLHLLICTWCARYLNQINFMRQLLREEIPNHKPHPGCQK